MAGFNLPFKFPSKKAQNNPDIDPSVQSTQPVKLHNSAASQPKKKSLADLEKEAEANYYALYPHRKPKPAVKAKAKSAGILGKLIGATILIGVPVGIVWVANLPYAMIRRPVAKTAPILLLPSYMKMDTNYRQAISSVEQAEQLIEKATSPADLNLGEEKVKAAQKNLEALPITFLNDFPEYNYWWYDWRFNIYQFNSARTKVGQLEAKVFQEKNAQTLLTDSEQALIAAKEQYQAATTPTDKQSAISAWRTAIDQLEQVPRQTLAGKTANTKIKNYQLDFKEVVGLAAGNERVSTLIDSAKQYSWKAAQEGQNPPHNVAKWEQIEKLWEQAITQLNEIRSDDLAGYAEAQRLRAEYSKNLGQVKIRQQAEQDSARTLEQAERNIQYLLAATPTTAQSLDRNRTISQLQGIINDLEKVQNGTTSYLKAQELLLQAKNKLNQLSSQLPR